MEHEVLNLTILKKFFFKFYDLLTRKNNVNGISS